MDPWFPIRPFVNAFNVRHREIMRPGKFIVVDECMCRWEGLEYDYAVEGLPHSTKEIRKPDPVGLEIKSMADGDTFIICFLEMLEGEDRQATKKFTKREGAHRVNLDNAYLTMEQAGDVYPPHTAITLRLVENYFGTGRVVAMDSAFMSVMTATSLMKHGLYSVGMVKTAHREYPKRYLQTWAKTNGPNGGPALRGSHCVLTSSLDIANVNYPIMAIGWYDKKLKTVLSNVGNTLAGNPSVRKRHYVVSDNNGEYSTHIDQVSIDRPSVIEVMFTYFGAIDIHDHYRQGSLGFEKYWSTRSWWHRVFGTIFGMIVVNSYFAYRYEYIRKNILATHMQSFDVFVDRLAHIMIHSNPWLVVPHGNHHANNNHQVHFMC